MPKFAPLPTGWTTTGARVDLSAGDTGSVQVTAGGESTVVDLVISAPEGSSSRITTEVEGVPPITATEDATNLRIVLDGSRGDLSTDCERLYTVDGTGIKTYVGEVKVAVDVADVDELVIIGKNPGGVSRIAFDGSKQLGGDILRGYLDGVGVVVYVRVPDLTNAEEINGVMRSHVYREPSL